MIGHDLVAWPPAPPTRLGTRRWSSKVLTAAEQTWRMSQPDPIWAAAWLWAVKEAAYKLAVKRGAARHWAPRTLEVNVEQGWVRHQSQPGTAWPLLSECHRYWLLGTA